jgi:mycofactocin precursor
MDQENNQTPVTPEVETTEAVVTEELLIEEISIDGMCGVY